VVSITGKEHSATVHDVLAAFPIDPNAHLSNSLEANKMIRFPEERNGTGVYPY